MQSEILLKNKEYENILNNFFVSFENFYSTRYVHIFPVQNETSKSTVMHLMMHDWEIKSVVSMSCNKFYQNCQKFIVLYFSIRKIFSLH